MKRAILISLAFSVLLIGWTETPAYAQTASHAIRLEQPKRFHKGVDAWPQILYPRTAAERKINATLSSLNLRLAAGLRRCDARYLRWANIVGMKPPQIAKETAGDWERKVRIAMRGPHWLSLVAEDSYIFCGGAHPDSSTTAQVFDLTTGEKLLWIDHLPTLSGAISGEETQMGGAESETLRWQPLDQIARQSASTECKDVFANSHAFQLWLDAKQGAVIAKASDLPHVLQSCAEELKISIPQARELGFDSSLIDALDLAQHSLTARNFPKGKVIENR